MKWPVLTFLGVVLLAPAILRAEDTSAKAPDKSYIPLLSGAHLLTKTPGSIPTQEDLEAVAASDKFVGVNSGLKVLRVSPDEAAMHPFNVALGIEQARSQTDLQASVTHVLHQSWWNEPLSSLGFVNREDQTPDLTLEKRLGAVIAITGGVVAAAGTQKDVSSYVLPVGVWMMTAGVLMFFDKGIGQFVVLPLVSSAIVFAISHYHLLF